MEKLLLAALAAIVEIAVSLKSIALSLEGARVAAQPPATSAAKEPAPSPAPVAPIPPVPPEDDLGLGDAKPKTYTLEEVQDAARKAIDGGKSRAAVKECMKKVGADNIKEIKPEKFAEFVGLLST